MATTDERVPRSFRIDPEDEERLQALAKQADRSVSAEIRRALREHLDRSGREDGHP